MRAERVVGGGALSQRAGEFLAVVDEFADETEQAPGAAGLAAGRGGGRVGHERIKNTDEGKVKEYFPQGAQPAALLPSRIVRAHSRSKLERQCSLRFLSVGFDGEVAA